MVDSDFWRELADKFRSIRDDGMLRVDWTATAKIGQPHSAVTQYRFVGLDPNSRSIQLEFEALARRGGAKIRPWTDSLNGWLDELASLQSETPQFAREFAPDGSVVAHINYGTIPSVCHASIDLCKILESRALEAERLAEWEKRENDAPRNWSALRQQFEAVRAIKTVLNTEPIEITEEFVRDAVARHEGIKQEDVTPERVMWEVSGMLPYYPAIRLVSSKPSQTPENVSDDAGDIPALLPTPDARTNRIPADRSRRYTQPTC